MSYELKDYLNAINYTKEKLLDSEDEMWEKKYAPFIEQGKDTLLG